MPPLIQLFIRLPSAGLLLIQLLGVLLYPLMEDTHTGPALFGAFGIIVLGAALRMVRRSAAVTWIALLLASATFTLLAWAFAYLFSACQLLAPSSFVGPVEPEATRSWLELLFLSFTTLSGVGLGDILPLRPFSRALVMLEEFAGVMYFTLV
ncbi:ion channel, partial [Azotobacter armeniacus]